MPRSSTTSSHGENKAKRQAEDAMLTSLKKGKKARTGAEAATNTGASALPPPTTNAPPRHSAHSGTGIGGRNVQLEKLSAVLEAPTWTNQSKGSTTLPPSVPVNPLQWLKKVFQCLWVFM